MIHVAGIWELGWNTPIKEVELWQFMLRDFGVEEFHMAPVTGIKNMYLTKEWANIQEIIEHHRTEDFNIVFVDERAEVELQDFVHPEKVLYVCGRANFSPLLGFKQEGDQIVKIKTVLNRGLLWPHQAMAVVLYDRGV